MEKSFKEFYLTESISVREIEMDLRDELFKQIKYYLRKNTIVMNPENVSRFKKVLDILIKLTRRIQSSVQFDERYVKIFLEAADVAVRNIAEKHFPEVTFRKINFNINYNRKLAISSVKIHSLKKMIISLRISISYLRLYSILSELENNNKLVTSDTIKHFTGLTSTLTHELLHVKQLSIESKTMGSKDTRYYGSNHEIQAYALTVAQNLLMTHNGNTLLSLLNDDSSTKLLINSHEKIKTYYDLFYESNREIWIQFIEQIKFYVKDLADEYENGE